jgi:hypothetical protein
MVDGFSCKACGRFFDNSQIKEWSTSWDKVDGEEWLRELIAKCPHCGEIRGYAIPGDVTLPP